MIHPEFEALVEYATGSLPKERSSTIDQHLVTCAECQNQLVSIRGFLENIRTGNQVAPRTEVLRRAVAAFRQFQERATNRNQRAANLLFDSWDHSAIGVRGYVTERQLLYQFLDFDIDLQIQPATDAQSYTIYGQILCTGTKPDLLEGVAVRLLHGADGQIVRQILIDHLGRFSLSDVPAGHYFLQIELSNTGVHLNELTLYPSE